MNRQISIGDLYDPAFAAMDQKSVVDNLEGIAYGVVEEEYTTHLNQEDLADRKSELSEVCIKISQLEQKKKDLLAEIKAELKPHKLKMGQTLDEIKHQSTRVSGKLYLIDDQDAKVMHYFDTTGRCVRTRQLTPDERQIKLQTLRNDGTNN